MKIIRVLYLGLALLLPCLAHAQIADEEILSLIGGGGGDEAWTWVRAVLYDTARASICVLVETMVVDLPVTDDSLQHSAIRNFHTHAYFAIYDAEMRTLQYGSYIGGDRSASAITMLWSENADELLLVGATEAPNLPVTPNARRKILSGRNDIWYARFSLASRRFTYLSYVGGDRSDYCKDALVSSDGKFVICGVTSSTDLPFLRTSITKPRTDSDGNASIFVLSGDSLQYVAVFGSATPNVLYEGIDYIVETENSYVFAGFTYGWDFPVTPGCLQPLYSGAGDIFLMETDKDFTTLHYSSYLGAKHTDFLDAVQQWGSKIHLVGRTGGNVGEFPTTHPPLGTPVWGGLAGFHVIYDAATHSVIRSIEVPARDDITVYDIAMPDERTYVLLMYTAADSLLGVKLSEHGLSQWVGMLVAVSAEDYRLRGAQMLSPTQPLGKVVTWKLWSTAGGIYHSGYVEAPVTVNPGGYRTTFLGGTEAFIGKLHLNINAQEALRPPVASLLSLSPFPNPARAAATALLTAAPGAYTLRIHGSDGRELRSQRVYCEVGGGSVSVPLDGLAAGHYQLSAVDAQGRIVARSALVVEGR